VTVPGTVSDQFRHAVWNNALLELNKVWGGPIKAWPVVNDAQREMQKVLSRFSPEIQLVAIVTLAEAALSSTALPETEQ